MFSVFHNHTHIYSNPFAMGAMAMNPRINFFLGLAAATSSPCNPFMGSLFNVSYPVFGYANPSPVFNPFGYINNNFNFSTPVFNNSFVYSGINAGIGSIPMMPVSFPIPKFSFSGFGSVTSSNNADNEPQGVNLNKNKYKYGPAFLNKVKEIAKRLNCNYRDLLGVMNSESGINAKAKNPNSSATGLIQFIESTARSLGTSTAALANMSPLEQLDYVEKYLQRAKSAAGLSSNDKLSGGQLYTLVFLPARAGRDVIASSGEAYYSANKGLDTNKDGKITMAELDQRVKNKYVSDNSFLA